MSRNDQEAKMQDTRDGHREGMRRVVVARRATRRGESPRRQRKRQRLLSIQPQHHIRSSQRRNVRDNSSEQVENKVDDIPVASSAASSMTDPMAANLATDNLVKENEQKLTALKKASAKENKSAEKRMKETKKQERQKSDGPRKKTVVATPSSLQSPKRNRFKSPIGRSLFKKSTKADAESKEVAKSTEDRHNGKQEKGKSANTPSANAKSLKKNTKDTDTKSKKIRRKEELLFCAATVYFETKGQERRKATEGRSTGNYSYS